MKLLDLSDKLEGWIIYTVFSVIAYMYFRYLNITYDINGHWQIYFDDFRYSSQTFYSTIETAVKGKEMPGVKMERVGYHDSTVLSVEREYLHIKRENDVYIICAAPFGNGFFISSRKGSDPGHVKKMVISIPFIGGVIARLFFKKSFYQNDSQNMFVSAVHDTVLDIIHDITKEKGVRDMTERERQFQRVGKQ
jgi:hypothetical protein